MAYTTINNLPIVQVDDLSGNIVNTKVLTRRLGVFKK